VRFRPIPGKAQLDPLAQHETVVAGELTRVVEEVINLEGIDGEKGKAGVKFLS